MRITHDHFEGPVAAAAQRLAEELASPGRRALELLDATVNKLFDYRFRLDGLDVRLPPLRRAAAGLDHSLDVLAQDVGVDTKLGEHKRCSSAVGSLYLASCQAVAAIWPRAA